MEEIGKRIQSEREKLNLTIEQVANLTKIREQHIIAIEEGNLDFLPPVYAMSFIKTYLKFLKINDVELNKSIKDVLKIQNQNSYSAINTTEIEGVLANPQDLFIKKKNNILTDINVVNYLVIFIIAVGAVIIFYFAFFSGDSRQQTIPKPAPQKTIIYYDTTKSDQNIASSQPLQQDSFRSDSIYLDILATEPSWIRIIPKGKAPEEMTLLTNQKKRWTATKYFTLTAGNAGALTLWRNGKQLPSIGKKGVTARNIRISMDSVINYNSPVVEIPKQVIIPGQKTSQQAVPKKNHQKKPIPKIVKPIPLLLGPSPIQKRENVIQEKKPDVIPIQK